MSAEPVTVSAEGRKQLENLRTAAQSVPYSPMVEMFFDEACAFIAALEEQVRVLSYTPSAAEFHEARAASAPVRPTRVVHCTRDVYDVYIGRGQAWGNPFVIGRDGTREDVIAKHRALVLADPAFVARIKRELKGKVLGCWCKPEACHGDTYVEIAESE